MHIFFTQNIPAFLNLTVPASPQSAVLPAILICRFAGRRRRICFEGREEEWGFECFLPSYCLNLIDYSLRQDS